MKLQSLAVIFAIIIIPISLVMSAYIGTQIDTVVLQTSYDSNLMNATHDAIKAFQLNQTNSNTQNIASEKIRDVKASISSFYSSLGTSMGASGYTEEDLAPYIPALVYTLYDGYYIYSPFQNISNGDKVERGLKPYMYYSARYKNSNVDVIINYTLDNYITVYGTINGTYYTKSGFLLDPAKVHIGIGNEADSYNGVQIAWELLSEVDDATYLANSTTEKTYKYITNENGIREKIYYNPSTHSWYKYTVDRKVIPATEYTSSVQRDNSARKYYEEAKEFSSWVQTYLGSIRVSDIVLDKKTELFGNNNSYLFKDFSGDNDPDNSKSIFMNHKREVIKNSIETNLYSAIAAYNENSQSSGTTYNFKMPKLSDSDWDKVLNNVSMISFMEGLPIKNKYYVGYSIVTNNKNREFVDPDMIYFIDSTNAYHRYDYSLVNYTDSLVGYRNIDFDARRVINSNNEVGYYLPHAELACYQCIVSSNPDKVITRDTFISMGSKTRQAYYTALARERYNNYKSNRFK